MAAGPNNIRVLVRKVDRQLTKLASGPAPNKIHRFRTNARRLEVVLTELDPRKGRNRKKLLKILGRLRKQAGKVRDLDVEIALLRSLKMPEGARHKSQLMQVLIEERTQREKKVAEGFDKPTVRELHKRLKRAGAEFEIADGAALHQATRILIQLEREPEPTTERVLHQYRIAGKRARYLAELAAQTPEAKRLIGELKGMQDALGEWHDWWKLTQRAESLFRGVSESPLLAALRNLTRAKFRHASLALADARSGLSRKAPGGSEGPSSEGRRHEDRRREDRRRGKPAAVVSAGKIAA